MADVFDLFGVEDEVDPKVLQAIEQLAMAVEGLTSFEREPDLFMVAVAVQDVLEAAGHHSHAAERWSQYEQGHRRTSKLEEARARANALYVADLEAIKAGWETIYKTEQSKLPWRQPGTVVARGGECNESGAPSATTSGSTGPTVATSTSTAPVLLANGGGSNDAS